MRRLSSFSHLSFAVLFLTSTNVVRCQSTSSSSSLFDSTPSSPACDDGESCSHQLSAASIVALTFVSLIFLLLICWCTSRVLLGTVLSRPLPSLVSLCRRSSPQIHLHLHSTDTPPLVPTTPPHPSTLSLYPFHGHYRIGSNLHLTPFTVFLHFHTLTSPRTVTGEGVDNGQPFLVHHGLFTSRGAEVRCTFEERFEDGSRYHFSGVGEEGVGGKWKGEWWKDGGQQGGVWTMEQDEEKWRRMEKERMNGGEAEGGEGGGDGQVGWTRRGWRERRTTIVGLEFEEQKEGNTRTSDRPQVERRWAENDGGVMIEMTELTEALTVTIAPSPAAVEHIDIDV